jgi:hypothetical protein
VYIFLIFVFVLLYLYAGFTNIRKRFWKPYHEQILIPAGCVLASQNSTIETTCKCKGKKHAWNDMW